MRRKFTSILFVTMFIFLVACQAGSENGASDQEYIEITHELGKVSVPVNPEKVVVFDFGALDTLDTLGIEVVGIPKGNVPSYLKKYEDESYENVGSLKEPDFDMIANINPDLIIISGRQSTLYDELSKLGATVYVDVDTGRYMESVKENLETLGKIFEKEAEIEAEIEKIEEKIAALNEQVAQTDQKALIILANDGKISAYGPKSRFGLIHDVFGVPAIDEKIEASTHGQNVSFEYIVEKDPDLLYVIDRAAVVGGETAAESFVENKLIEQTKAYKNDQIYYLDPNYWYLSGGGIISLQEMIHHISESFQ